MRVGSGQDQGDGLGEVAHDRVGFLEQPQGDAGRFGGPFAQARGDHGALGAAAGKEGDGPETVGVLGLPEVAREGGDLGVHLGGAVEGGEELGEAPHRGGDIRAPPVPPPVHTRGPASHLQGAARASRRPEGGSP